MDDRYNWREALRIHECTVGYHHHVFTFRVRDSGGTFDVFLATHTLSGGEVCKYVNHPRKLACGNSPDLKAALLQAIEEHMRDFHHLSVVDPNATP